MPPDPDEDLDFVVFNGLDAATGGYLLDDLPIAAAAKLALGQQLEAGYLEELRNRHGDVLEAFRADDFGFSRKKLSESGWGIVFAAADDERNRLIREQLKPLLELRREQAGALYRDLDGVGGFQPRDSKPKFLQRLGAGGGGAARPELVPYYLMIAASPDAIPYSFEYQLSVQYAVGRIHFDELDDYGRYARAVVAAEDEQVRRERRAVFLGVQNPGDRATRLSSTRLVQPLAATMQEEHPDWEVRTILDDDATKTALTDVLCDDDLPALLFTASHGLGLAYDACLPASDQGALVCRDWEGPIAAAGLPIEAPCYFSGRDIDALDDRSRVAGLISFHFACFGAGTPRRDSFNAAIDAARLIAEKPFVGHLPQRLLGSPHGGALACVGHVDRAIPASFMWRGGGVQLGLFEQMIGRLADGYPVGCALGEFPERYAEITVDIDEERRAVKAAERDADDRYLARLWSAQMDSRSYVVVGDPAVRLAIE